MNGGFMRGLIVGSIVGASIGMIVNPDFMSGRTKRRIMRNKRNFLRKSGELFGNVVEMFR